MRHRRIPGRVAGGEYAFTVRPTRPLLTGTPQEILATHDTLQRLIRKTTGKAVLGTTDVAFDLSKVPDIDPGAVLLMMHAGHSLSSQGWEPYAIDTTGQSLAMRKVSKNLQHLRLSPSDRINFPSNEGEYPLRAVFDRSSMVTELVDWSSTVQVGTTVEPEQVAMWGVQISEVVTNSFQHAPTPPKKQLPPIYLAGGVRQGSVQLAALDRGRGIPKTIEEVASEAMRKRGHGALIRHACKRGVTSHSTRQNQGAGLPDLIESVTRNGGTLTIFSQGGFVHLERGKLSHKNLERSDRRIAGTFTIVSLLV